MSKKNSYFHEVPEDPSKTAYHRGNVMVVSGAGLGFSSAVSATATIFTTAATAGFATAAAAASGGFALIPIGVGVFCIGVGYVHRYKKAKEKVEDYCFKRNCTKEQWQLDLKIQQQNNEYLDDIADAATVKSEQRGAHFAPRFNFFHRSPAVKKSEFKQEIREQIVSCLAGTNIKLADLNRKHIAKRIAYRVWDDIAIRNDKHEITKTFQVFHKHAAGTSLKEVVAVATRAALSHHTTIPQYDYLMNNIAASKIAKDAVDTLQKLNISFGTSKWKRRFGFSKGTPITMKAESCERLIRDELIDFAKLHALNLAQLGEDEADNRKIYQTISDKIVAHFSTRFKKPKAEPKEETLRDIIKYSLKNEIFYGKNIPPRQVGPYMNNIIGFDRLASFPLAGGYIQREANLAKAEGERLVQPTQRM